MSDSSIQELVEFLVKQLVDLPDEVEVVEEPGDDDETIYLEVHVAESDKGKIIGKRGRIANALRTVIRAAAQKAEVRAFVEIVS